MIPFVLLGSVLIVGVIYLFFNPLCDIYSTHKVETSRKVVALTFDDGPDPNITPLVLDILKKCNVRATFFVVGKNVVKYPEVLRRAFKEGHQIANHSFNHNYKMFSLPSKILRDSMSTNELIFQVIKKRPLFFRPPFGLKTYWGARILNKNGFKIVTWNNMTTDYLNKRPAKLVHKIVLNTKKGGIIVLHDGSEGLSVKNRSNLVESLENIIQALKAQGFQFIRLDTMFNEDGYF